MSDDVGAALMLPTLPRAKVMLADKGYDADWFRQALDPGIALYDGLPGSASLSQLVRNDAFD